MAILLLIAGLLVPILHLTKSNAKSASSLSLQPVVAAYLYDF
jgi:hypothetical protein